jgi:hypothetical protein
MKLTNKYDLPQTLINLYEKQREEYAETKGDADVSVTQLLRSPRIDLLRKKHFRNIEEDISDRLWAVLGTVIHRIMQDGADEEHIAEENLKTKVMGWTIKGGIDVVRKGNHVSILDYKFTKAYKYQKGDFLDWEEQMNLYALLLRIVKDLYVDNLEVVMFVRDFSQGLVDQQKNYPPASTVRIPIKLWTKEKQQTFLEKKIREHQDARRAYEWGEDLPLCTDRDRWLHPGTYVVRKKGAARATKVFEDDIKVAGDYKMSMKKPDDYEVYLRQKAPARCAGDWCGVSKWCDQWAKDKDKWDEKSKN